MESTAVLVPVKSFATAKGRLAPALDAEARAALARTLAEGVLAACAGLRVAVVCEDAVVAAWAEALGAEPLLHDGSGLDDAVRHGVAVLAEAGVDRVLVTHADLAAPAALRGLVDLDGVVLVPDRHLDGTNALVVPARAGFGFSYGPGSFARHLSEAERLGRPVHVVRGSGLELDIDDRDDLACYRPATTHAGGGLP